MLADFRTAVADGDTLRFDVAVAGGGPAGITLALELMKTGLSVGLFEGGDLDEPGEGQSLYEGSVGERPYPLPASRLRLFGGSSNHWGGWCRPLDPIDLEVRDWIPHSGWPLAFEELERWYPRAHELCEIPSSDYTVGRVLQDPHQALLEFGEGSGVVTKLFRFSPPTRFGSVYREQLRRATSVHAFVNANVTRVDWRQGEATGLRVQTLGGSRARVHAGAYVLAMGGLETPRVLLHSSHQGVALGDHSGWLGRTFMDHFGSRPAFVLTAPELRYRRFAASAEESVMPVLSFSDETQRRHGLANSCAQLSSEASDPDLPPEALANPIFGGRWGGRRGLPWRYRVQAIHEPTPNPESRVTLADEVDALGMRRLHLEWRISPVDFDHRDRMVALLSRAFGMEGHGRIQHVTLDQRRADAPLSTGMHHLGTTRMSAVPERGVVDRDCRIHGCENLFVASSSVFPTAGFANPTLTIVALAARLASRLGERWPGGGR